MSEKTPIKPERPSINVYQSTDSARKPDNADKEESVSEYVVILNIERLYLRHR